MNVFKRSEFTYSKSSTKLKIEFTTYKSPVINENISSGILNFLRISLTWSSLMIVCKKMTSNSLLISHLITIFTSSTCSSPQISLMFNVPVARLTSIVQKLAWFLKKMWSNTWPICYGSPVRAFIRSNMKSKHLLFKSQYAFCLILISGQCENRFRADITFSQISLKSSRDHLLFVIEKKASIISPFS